MLPPRLRDELERSFAGRQAGDTCVMCRAPLETGHDDFPCLHWLISSAQRAASPAHLKRVFERFDVDMAVDYLRIVATSGPSGSKAFHARDGHYFIRWGRRRWAVMRDGEAKGSAYKFVIFRRGGNAVELRVAGTLPDQHAIAQAQAAPA